MVGLRRFFSVEKLSQPSADPANQDNKTGSRCPTRTEDRSTPSRTSTPYRWSPNLKVSQSVDGKLNPQYAEERLPTLPDNGRAPSALSGPRAESRTSSRLTNRSGHIDLVDALFTSHRYQMENARTMSPTTPYNEDIAERNMARFFRLRSKGQLTSRLISALCQEDVADRNISQSLKGSRSFHRPTSRTSATQTSPTLRRARRRDLAGHPQTKADPKPGRPAVLEGLRSVSHSQLDHAVAAREQWRPRPRLRSQRSAPDLSRARQSRDQTTEQKVASSVAHLNVPPIYKQGKRMSNTPLPDSPTIPIPPPRQEKATTEKKPRPKTPPSRCSSLKSNSSSPSASSMSSGRKNVRDLSINTDLARAKPTRKISHRAIQPPTPSNADTRQNPSIAEVMNSPLPPEVPASISPVPISSEKIAEIMNMFHQAYASTKALTQHPTFETLQDAIIREINSHEAFQKVPVPDPGPPFIPSSTQDSVDRTSNSSRSSGAPLARSLSAKESQLTRLMRRGPRHSRSSESNKSLSSTVFPIGFEKRTKSRQGSGHRRRHTDAPPPSPRFFDAEESLPQDGNQVSHVDVPKQRTSHANLARPASKETKLDHSQSTRSLSPQDRKPTVYHMRAQTSTSSSSETQNSENGSDEEDDDVIQLPSVQPPRIQVQGTDKNDVKYVVENGTSADGYRLVPDQSKNPSPPVSPASPGWSPSQANAFPIPPRSHLRDQLRSTRSMEVS